MFLKAPVIKTALSSLGVLALALLIRAAITPWLGEDMPFITVFGAVAFAVWYGGWRIATGVTVAGFLLCSLLFIEPIGKVGLIHTREVIGGLAYLVTCSIIIAMGVAQHRARARERATEEEKADLLRKSEQQNRLLAETVPQLVWTCAADGRCDHLGRQWVEYTGIPEADQLGYAWSEQVHPDDRDTLLAAWQEAHTQGVPMRVEFRIRRHDGVYRWFYTLAVPLRDENGDVVKWYGSNTDVHDLREARDRAARAEEAARMGVWETDLRTGSTYLSPGFRRLYGLDADRTYTMNEAYELPHPDDREGIRRSFEEVVARKGVEWSSTNRYIHPELGVRWQFGRSRITYGPDGSPLRVSGTSVDVTELRQAEEALRKSEEMYRLISEAAAGLLYDHDPLTDRIIRSPGVSVLTGVPFEDIPPFGSWWAERIHPEDMTRMQATMPAVLAQRLPTSMAEYRVRHADGHWVHVMEKARLLYDDEGRLVRMVGNTVDVTERVRAENELRKAAERKDEFLATLSHELRNPLAPLRNSMQLLREELDPALRDRVLDMADRQLTHMVRLIDDLMDVSRISRGKITLRRERVLLDRIITEAVEACKPLIDRARHSLVLEVVARDVVLQADHARLVQIITNLLSNAAKYTPDGGTIRVQAQRIGTVLRIVVQDDGVGIAHEKQADLFELFSQVDSSLERSQGGLGIGLHLVKKLVELHHGVVEVQSNGPGTGSTFAVHLPLDEQDSSAVPEAHPIPPSGGCSPMRILVVDDNVDNAISLSMVLRKQGHEALALHHGTAALEALETFKPQVVLLDIGMPDMTGYEVAQAIRSRADGSNYHLVALTGWGQEEDKRKAISCGFDQHMTKPIDMAGLRESILEASRRFAATLS